MADLPPNPPTTLADPKPLSQRMLAAIVQYVPKHPTGLEVIGLDVIYGSFNVNGMLVNGYALLITVRGALLGPQYNIVNAHIIPPTVPNELEAREMVHISTSRLREAKAAQSRIPQGGQDGRTN